MARRSKGSGSIYKSGDSWVAARRDEHGKMRRKFFATQEAAEEHLGSNGLINLSPEERFWRNVAKAGLDECWLWQGPLNWQGYGVASWRGATVVASRLAYILAYGPMPEGHLACHTCDNPPCCNPAHMFAGTSSDNINDAVSKGRWRPKKQAA